MVISNNAENQRFVILRTGNNIYFDETEVDVVSWLSYYSWTIIHEGFDAVQKVLSDNTTVKPELWAYVAGLITTGDPSKR